MHLVFLFVLMSNVISSLKILSLNEPLLSLKVLHFAFHLQAFKTFEPFNKAISHWAFVL